eukprot:TRINITY_DN9490_c0_g2_i1.p1 TRINITY_DN9490_c0_g2~~TRINITY_DN9490_c0_g2_i1.p1  ORF type:complete len:683 (+),score=165.50 TRINITY_DN9490_c0_g2_i1:76-2124(+)
MPRFAGQDSVEHDAASQPMPMRGSADKSVVHVSSTEAMETELFKEEYVLPIGAVLRGLEIVEREELFSNSIAYVAFVGVFVCIMVLGQPASEAFEVQEALRQSLLEAAGSTASRPLHRFREIASDEQFWDWSEAVLLQEVFRSPRSGGYAIADYNRLHTPLRIWQLRSSEVALPEAAAGLPRFANVSATPSRHLVELPLQPEEALAELRRLRSTRWSDEMTRSVAVEVNSFNPNYGLLTTMEFQVDRGLGGDFRPVVTGRSCRANPYATSGDYCRGVLEVVFVVGLVAYLLSFARRLCTRSVCYFSQLSLMGLEGLYLAALCGSIVYYIDYVARAEASFSKIWQLTPDEYAGFCDSWLLSSRLASAALLWSAVYIFATSALLARFAVLWDILAESLYLLACVFGLVALALVGFGASAMWMFGGRLEEFSTVSGAVEVLLQSLMLGCLRGGNGSNLFMRRDVQHILPSAWSAAVWALLWLLVCALVFLRILLAVLVRSFARVRERRDQQDEVEKHFAIHPWSLFLQAKVYNLVSHSTRLFKDIDLREAIELLIADSESWRVALLDIDRQKLKAKVLKDVVAGDRDLEIMEVMELFPSSMSAKDKYVFATDWMRRLSLGTGLAMRRMKTRPTTMVELQVLTNKLCELEEEACGLTLQLRDAMKGNATMAGDFESPPLPLFADPI